MSKSVVKKVAAEPLLIKAITDVRIEPPMLQDTLEANLAQIQRFFMNASMFRVYSYWCIGKITCELQSQPHKYGSQIVDKVAAALNRQKTFVYECETFYKHNKDGDVLALQQYRNLDFSHFSYIYTLEDPVLRGQLLQEADTEEYTVEQVRKWVRAHQGKALKAPVPKQLPPAETPCGVLARVQTCTKKALRQVLEQRPVLVKALQEVQRQDGVDLAEIAEEQTSGLRQMFKEIRTAADDNLQALKLEGSAGAELFRGLRELLMQTANELQAYVPQLHAEYTRLSDEVITSEAAYEEALRLFKQVAIQAARVKSVCATLMQDYHELADE
jgi:hypothetical protein